MRKPLMWIHALLALLVYVVVSHHFGSETGELVAGAPLLLKYVPKTYDVLRSLVKPDSSDEPESFPHVLFDTQAYAAAGSATLTFFKSTAANLIDPTLSNFANGQLETYQFFEIHRVFILIHSVPSLTTTAAVTGSANDVEILHKTARGILGFRMNGKQYGDFPMWFHGRPGGPAPFAVAEGTETAPARNIVQFGETDGNGGFPMQGAIIIPPATQFSAVMQFNSTAISAQTNIAVALMGVMHRKVG